MNIAQLIAHTKASDKHDCVFEREKIVITKSSENYPGLNTALQNRLYHEGYKAYNLEGTEINLFSFGELTFNMDEEE